MEASGCEQVDAGSLFPDVHAGKDETVFGDGMGLMEARGRRAEFRIGWGEGVCGGACRPVLPFLAGTARAGVWPANIPPLLFSLPGQSEQSRCSQRLIRGYGWRTQLATSTGRNMAQSGSSGEAGSLSRGTGEACEQ